jgi:hypothetical protein
MIMQRAWKTIQVQFGWNVLDVAFWLLLMPGVACGGPNSASFESGHDVDVLVAKAGPSGTTLKVGKIGSPVDAATVEIPEGALSETVTIRLYYNTGKFTAVSGKPSGVVFGISAGNLKRFRHPLKIRMRYDAKRHAGTVVVGFAIDFGGRVSGFQLLSQDEKAGTVTFATLVPVLFTWIYATV